MSTTGPVFKAIVAMASNRVIGREGALPWRLPEDLKSFKKITTGHPIVMGRTTFESIGRPLPGRRNIILSTTLEDDRVDTVSSIDALIALGLEGDVYVIGGAKVYAQMLPLCREILLSYVFEAFEGDTFFPPFEDDFELAETLYRTDDFELRRYVACRAEE